MVAALVAVRDVLIASIASIALIAAMVLSVGGSKVLSVGGSNQEAPYTGPDFEAAFGDWPAFEPIPPLFDEHPPVELPPPSEEQLARQRAIEQARRDGTLGKAALVSR